MIGVVLRIYTSSAISIFMYPGFKVRTVPPVSVRVRNRVKVSFSFKVLCFEFD